jgi:hypothetical protein
VTSVMCNQLYRLWRWGSMSRWCCHCPKGTVAISLAMIKVTGTTTDASKKMFLCKADLCNAMSKRCKEAGI